MADGKLYIGFDFFHAGSYSTSSGEESYEHDRKHCYLILQPLLMPAGHADHVSLADYVGTWTADSLDADHIAVMDTTVMESLRDDELEPLPVPFPPGTTLGIKCSWDSGKSFNAEHKLTSYSSSGAFPSTAEPLLLTRDSWHRFAFANGNNPFVDDWQYLSGPDQEEVLDWAVGLLAAVRTKVELHKADPDQPEPSDYEKRIYKCFVKANKVFTSTAPIEQWKDRLNDPRKIIVGDCSGSKRPLVRELYNYLIGISPEESKINPPRFRHALDKLQQNIDIIVPDKIDGDIVKAYSYHAAMWRQIKVFIERTKDGDDKQKPEEMLKTLYGLGERLRWPNYDFSGAYQDLMLVNLGYPEDPVKDWIGTNAHSLLGQVFRIGAIEDALVFTVGELKIQAYEVDKAIRDELAVVIKKLFRHAEDFPSDKLAANLIRDDGWAGRFVRFKPKIAQMSLTGFRDPDGNPVLSVPEALLDQLVDANRRTTSGGPGKLMQPGSPRRGVRATELYRPWALFPERTPSLSEREPLPPSLYRPLFLLNVVLRPMPLTASSLGMLFRMTLRDQPHPDDWRFLMGLLGSLGSSTSGRDSQLWVVTRDFGATERFELTGKIESVAITDKPMEFSAIIADAEGTLQGILERAESAQSSIKDPTKDGRALVDLVFRVMSYIDPEQIPYRVTLGDDDEEPFSHLVPVTAEAAVLRPYLALTKRFDRAVSISVQRYAERVHLDLEPKPKSPIVMAKRLDKGPIVGHLSNFNKLRLSLLAPLQKGRGSTRNKVTLTWPDALAPLPLCLEQTDPWCEQKLPWEVAPRPSPDEQYFSYWLEHHFDQEIREKTNQIEVGRYQSYLQAGQEWDLIGTAEHQYTHRIPASADEPLILGKANEIRHIAELLHGGRTADERRQLTQLQASLAQQAGSDAVSNTTGRRLTGNDIEPAPALSFDYLPGGTRQEGSIVLRFNKRYLQLLLEEYANRFTDSGKDLGRQSREERPAKLRPFYEALADLIAAIESGGAKLLLERWNFDNSLGGIFDESRRNDSSDPNNQVRYPEMIGNLKPVEFGTLDLRAFFKVLPAGLESLKSVLKPTFVGFKEKIQDLATTGGDKSWLDIRIPLGRTHHAGSKWRWTGEPGEPISETTNLIRLGLRLKRASENVISQKFARGKFLQMAIDDTGGEKGLAYLQEDEGFQGLAGEAAAELEQLLNRDPDPDQGDPPLSSLLQRQAWIVSRDTRLEKHKALPDVRKPGDDTLTGVALQKKLLGELQPYLNLPDEQRAAVDRVVDFFYVPHAFRPLEAHPLLGDIATTMQFAGYLLSIVDDIAHGRALSQLELASDVDFEKAKVQRARLSGLLDAIVQKISDLLAVVDDKQGMQSWPEPDFPIENEEKCRRQTEQALFNQVHGYLDALKNSGTEKLEDAFKAIVRANLRSFELLKGVGVVVFHPDRFSLRLAGLQIAKKVREASGCQPDTEDGVQLAPREDVDRFTFADFRGSANARFMLDRLDDKTYDNEFEIDQTEFSNAAGPINISVDTTRIGEERRFASDGVIDLARGGVVARSGEDLLEGVNHYRDATDGSGQRNIEANVVHYNPEWRIRREGKVDRFMYLLPSRLPPTVPVAVRPKGGIVDDQQGGLRESPWLSRITLSNPGSSPNMEKEFVNAINGILDNKAQVEVESKGGDGEHLKAESENDTRARAESGMGVGFGWHHVESYVSHYYFLITGDEEGLPCAGAFNNDLFEIEVDVGRAPFVPEPRDEEKKEADFNTPLMKWYLYHSQTREGKTNGGADLPKPRPVPSLKNVVDEIDAWLVNPTEATAKKGLLRPRNPDSVDAGRKAVAPEGVIRTRTLYRHGAPEADANWNLNQLSRRIAVTQNGNVIMQNVADCGDDCDTYTQVGAVLAADIMTLERTTGSGEGEKTESNSEQYLLRISVLDEPWTFTRARLRVKRNFRDVDGNDDPDMNPAFRMVSGVSDWSTYGLQTLRIGEEQFRELPDIVSAAVSQCDSLEQWYNKTPDHVGNFGSMIERIITAQFESSDGQRLHYWNKTAATSQKRKVTAFIGQVIGDPSIFFQDSTENTELKKARVETHDRQHLQTVTANQLTDLPKNISRKFVPPSEGLRIVATWHSETQSGETHNGDPVLEVTWPIRFRRDAE